jgi:hypothetical protein
VAALIREDKLQPTHNEEGAATAAELGILFVTSSHANFSEASTASPDFIALNISR